MGNVKLQHFKVQSTRIIHTVAQHEMSYDGLQVTPRTKVSNSTNQCPVNSVLSLRDCQR